MIRGFKLLDNDNDIFRCVFAPKAKTKVWHNFGGVRDDRLWQEFSDFVMLVQRGKTFQPSHGKANVAALSVLVRMDGFACYNTVPKWKGVSTAELHSEPFAASRL